MNPSITTKGTNLSVVVSGSAFFRRGKNCRADLEEMKFRLFYFRGSPFSSRAPLTSVQESSQPVVIDPELLPRLTLRAPIVPAAMYNDAGIVGAAMAVKLQA